jgi:hypothetical protein
MAVYVDDMRAQFGKMIMSHMIADSDAELHAMAMKIGVSCRWHQAPPNHDSHYDIAPSKRALAVSAGAVEITWRQAGCMVACRRMTGELGKPEDAEEWSRNRIKVARTTALSGQESHQEAFFANQHTSAKVGLP